MEWVASIIPSVAVALFMFYFERRMKKQDDISSAISAARKEECLLGLELQMAGNKMSYATAMALKRGYANGEVEEAIEAYEPAKKKYIDFMNKQAADHLII